MNPLSRYFLWWRTTVVRDREIVDAVVHPDHRGPSAELAAALETWPGTHYWARDDGDGRLVLIRALARRSHERWWLHTTLFLVTFLTVWMGGTLLAGSPAPLAFPFSTNLALVPDLIDALAADFVALGPALDFAMALMAILLAHESGHYLLAKRYGINASPPYFLPAPPAVNFIGTFGAFIRLRSPIVDRRQLMDVGAAGPWAGFVVAVVALVGGLLRSHVLPGDPGSGQLILLLDRQIHLGDSPIMYVARQLLVGDGVVVLHPLALAGWIGMFVTMLNLLPLAQLDGGHVLYALVGRRQAIWGTVTWWGMIVLGVAFWRWLPPHSWEALWWWVWAALILVLGRGRLAHPEVLDRYRALPRSRRPLGWATLLLFAVTFTPVPIHSF